jgi:hypothetical protein
MSRFWRNLLCISIGIVSGGFGGIVVLIFWPLLFPEPLHGSTLGEDAGPVALIAFWLLFGVTGFLLCRRVTRKHVRDKDDVTVLFR